MAIEELIVGLGGSATNDGGAGMAQALGFRLLDASGETSAAGGAALAQPRPHRCLRARIPLLTPCCAASARPT